MMQTTLTEGIRVRYIYSACVVTETLDVRILHDPWFTQGIYDGAWFHYPKVEDPISSIGDVNLVYVSHIHPDHYDGEFLKRYFSVYGVKEVLIADHLPNHLANKMRAEGIKPTVLQKPRRIGRTEIEILPHRTGSASDIDSAMILRYEGNTRRHCVVNVNDIIFDDAMTEALKNAVGEIDILLCGYTGAGPYPQTYFDLSDTNLIDQANDKKGRFFARYMKLVNSIRAKKNVPFAGKYILGGKLANLNAVRGVADAVEVLAFDPDAVVLADDGGEIDTMTFQPSAVRTMPYSNDLIERRIKEIRAQKMDYERLISEAEIHQLPLKRLLGVATRNAIAKSECDHDYYFCINMPSGEYAVINANRDHTAAIKILPKELLPTPRSEIYIDPRYLFGLLTNIYHWNNAEVGSQYNTRRYPNVLDRKAQSFLNFLAI
jgi:UDP-MurNAc hydroxylase